LLKVYTFSEIYRAFTKQAVLDDRKPGYLLVEDVRTRDKVALSSLNNALKLLGDRTDLGNCVGDACASIRDVVKSLEE
jgi:hypothetical protein